jgi:DNA-binding GntR family transcriptional regulator
VPLREAVPLLEVDGFVRTLPRRSAIVSTWTLRSVHEVFDLRLCLEVGAARYAARQIATGASADPLEAALNRSWEGLNSGDPYRIAGNSTSFHEIVVDLADNELMRSVTRSVSGRMMWLFYLTSELDPLIMLRGHEELLAGIRSGNERLAESVAYTQIERDRLESVRVLREQPGFDDELT